MVINLNFIGLTVLLATIATLIRYGSTLWLGAFWGVTLSNATACLVLSIVLGLKQSEKGFSPLVLLVLAFAFCGALSTFSSYIELLYRYATEYNFYKLVNFIVINHLICALTFFIGLRCTEKYLALSIS